MSVHSQHAAIDSRRSTLSGVLIGIGLMAAVDEIVFHQILAWHHFYDRATPAVALLSDGLLHSAELIFLIAGFFVFAEARRRQVLVRASAWAGFFIGAGGFQLFDGIVDHEILRLHQVRYVDNVLPYDLGWNAFGALLLIVGIVIYRRRRSADANADAPRG